MSNSRTNPVPWMARWKDFEYEVEDVGDIAVMRDRLFDAGPFVLSETVCATQVQLMAAGWKFECAEAIAKCEYFARELILRRADPSLAFFAHVDFEHITDGEMRLIAPSPFKRKVVFSGPLSEIDALARDDWDWR
ncbi:hypothetical protein [Tropicimonas sp. IMCC6043]|uniref:hypothetical protein n=1 Tax=Tropicimonas sp. IMCC6043 TaxID=2510645 RepID=UPI00101C377D|nr:hypothetical protein [Tropicimonas sp. IMCC6043]RYH06038.1 hypothetical protein EU800_25175 [Tropicimonas sp. IMCC6043]